ncbi:restriction endonuclease subunit S [Campylobacter lanienae]|uniref:restriction endonuclease subunit S n=1 Tax=Campylobacter lanienae TaxID=75658 RepID=UPI000BB44CB6|nr:restriction endonuclease subunit S [Campylobacter lanienae]
MMNKIPKGWEVKKLGEICEIISKGTTPKGGKNVYKDSGILFLRAENIQENGIVNLENVKFIDKNIHDNVLKRSKLYNGDLLITIAGTLGRCAVYNNDIEANINQAVCFVRLNKAYKKYANFIQKFISLQSTKSQLLNQAKITAIPNLTLEIIKNLPIPLPPLSEQNLIVAEIDKRFTIVDKTLNFIDTSIQNAKNLKQSILKKAFSGELRSEI